MTGNVFRHIGFRGYFFLKFGLFGLIVGLGNMNSDIPRQARINASVMIALAPLTIWWSLWAAAGVLCLLAAFWKSLEKIAAGAFSALCVFFTVGYGLAELTVPEANRAWVSAVYIGAMSGAVLIVAAWPEPVRRKIPK